MDLQVRNTANDSADDLSVADTVFAVPFNEPLVHQVVTAYAAGGRAGTKAQKSRAAVRGGGAKPWRQKGTGRARAGTIRSPIWRAGGTTFAAAPRSFGQKVNRKMYRGALRAIFSELQRQQRLTIVNELALADGRTKTLKEHLVGLGVRDVLFVERELTAELALGSRNIANVDACDVRSVNPLVLIRHENVVMTTEAVRAIEEWLG